MRTRFGRADTASCKDRRHRAAAHFKFLILNMILSTTAGFRSGGDLPPGYSPERRGK
jgi:hypothetical protein